MTVSLDILLKNGTLVDPVHKRNGRFDVGIVDGKIAEIELEIALDCARSVFDISGLVVVPGIIDLHTHLGFSGSRRALGHQMMAEVGVTTALDMAGPIDHVIQRAGVDGAGLNVASIQQIRPGVTVPGEDPSKAEIRSLLRRSLEQGAIGLKILGGHYPLTPEATARTIEVADDHHAYVAFHAGTTEAKSNLEGFLQAVELAKGHPLHMAHVNSYCRGMIQPCTVEAETAVEALIRHPNICSESYLSPLNGTSGECIQGIPASGVTCICLKRRGFPASEKGLETAIMEGWAQVNMAAGGKNILVVGAQGVEWWRRHDTRVTLSFNINPPEPRFRLATARQEDGTFVVDALSTDGGEIPRNVIVEMGLAMVKLQALSIEDFVFKTSRNPAGILGLKNKGQLGIGADADVTVLDLSRQQAHMSLSNGRVIMFRGHVCGTGSHVITTPAGLGTVKAAGLEAIVVDPSETPFYRR